MADSRWHRCYAARWASVTVLLIVCSPGVAAAREPADLVLLGGKVVTMDDGNPMAEALAVRGDRIVAVGSDEQIRPWVDDTTCVIALDGRLTIPGLIESHAHFTDLGRSKRILNLTKARDWDEIVRLVAQQARKTPAGTWIEGRGWHQAKWDATAVPSVDGCPTHRKLSQAVPDHPVLLTHASGHMSLANAKAMQLAGIDRNTPDPPGGEVLRDGAGEPIGAFRETAAGAIVQARDRSRTDLTAKQEVEELDEAIRLATEECLCHGVTTFHDAGESFATVDRYHELARDGRLQVRLYAMLNESNAALARRLPDYRLIGEGNHHLTVRGIKRLLDGALGVHGAWFFEPYEDLPDSKGLNTMSLAALRQTAQLALEHDFQLCVHAIGDRANRETLDVYEAVFSTRPEQQNLRWRIEHAQHVHDDDIPRFARLGVIASMQGVHCTSDAPFVVRRLGTRRARRGAYVWRSLLDAGATIANGTDAPVEDVDPIACFYASVTRRLADGTEFFPEQRMTREEALRSYTRDAAYAAFEEKLKGSLSVGKLADVVVLSEDIMSLPADEIPRARVEYTIVGGRVLYEREDGSTP